MRVGVGKKKVERGKKKVSRSLCLFSSLTFVVDRRVPQRNLVEPAQAYEGSAPVSGERQGSLERRRGVTGGARRPRRFAAAHRLAFFFLFT